MGTLTEEDARHIQNSKLLTKLLWLVDSGGRGIVTVELPRGTFRGIMSYETYRDSNLAVAKYREDFFSEQQWKVWTGDKKLVFHASEVGEGRVPENPTFLWRFTRPHGRLQPSNTFRGNTRMPSITEPLYELNVYERGQQWEEEVTRIVRGMARPGSRLFNSHYHSERVLELTESQKALISV